MPVNIHLHLCSFLMGLWVHIACKLAIYGTLYNAKSLLSVIPKLSFVQP